MQNLTPADFYKPSPYNFDTKNQIWLSQLTDAHDNFCDCNTPFSHLLSSIFPPGHQDRDLTITEILQRDFQQKCHSGGDAATSHGGAPGTGPAGDGPPEGEGADYIKDEDLSELIDAANAAADER